MAKEKVEAFETFNFDLEPIRGFPELRWAGKRPFTSAQYYPAQLKEEYGHSVKGWWNKIFWGDNLQVMSHLLREFRGKIDLIYVDPPFDSKADYKKSIVLRGQTIRSDQNAFEEKQYSDIWNNDDYVQYMYERLVLLRELLANDGSIFVHVGVDMSHYMRCLLEEVFGRGRLVNEIIWRKAFAHNDPSRCGNIHDSIYYFSKSPQRTWNRVLQKIDKDYVETFFDSFDPERNERYNRLPLDAPKHGDGGNLVYEWKGAWPAPGRTWAVIREKMEEYDRQGLIHYPKKVGGIPRLKRYESDHEGTLIQDLWIDINKLHNQSDEISGYPTQKPEELIERIILAASNENDLVLDCFMGSGTTQAVAMKLGRRFIGADINLGSIETTVPRLNNIRAELGRQDNQLPLSAGETPRNLYTGFQLYNVNDYDLFRNPVEAKELIKEALELHPLSQDLAFDGDKDGFLVKIMPVNRIATRQDLNELITSLNFKAFQRRRDENPTKPVEKIMLVCMGHEPDLGEHLKLQAKPFDIEVQVIDILRDKSHLHFKRSADGKLAIEGDMLVISSFYPMNLLQKLSLERVDDWRQLVETIKIDWNYDGAVLSPSTIDNPEAGELVKGRYSIPKDAGTIRVKITDLLSESWEASLANG